MKPITFGPVQAVVLAIILVVIAVLMFAAGTHCGADPTPVIIPTGIDAGPGESAIAERLDGAIQAHEAAIAEAERRYEEDIAAFDESQREKYERLQEEDLDTVVEFLRRWHEQRSNGHGG